MYKGPPLDKIIELIAISGYPMSNSSNTPSGTPAERLAQQGITKASALLNLGEHDKAVQELREVYPHAPQLVGAPYARALYARARAAEQAGHVADAFNDYQIALNVAPPGPLQNELVAIISQFAEGIQSTPTSAPLPPAGPQASGSMQANNQAAISTAPMARCPRCQQDIQSDWVRCPYCRLDLRASVAGDVDSIFDAAMTAYYRDRWLEARELLREVVSRDPDYVRSGERAASILVEVEQELKKKAAPVKRKRIRPRLVVPALLLLGLLAMAVVVMLWPSRAPGPSSASMSTATVLAQQTVSAAQSAAAQSSATGLALQMTATADASVYRGISAGNAGTVALLYRLPQHADRVTSVAFSPDGKLLASGSQDTIVRLWQAADGKPLEPLLKGHTGGVTDVAFSPQGDSVASGSSDGTVKLWSVANHTLLRTLEAPHASVNGLAFSPDGKTLAAGVSDNKVWLWNTSDWSSRTLEGHEGAVDSVAFSSDGKTLASGSEDKSVRLWNVEDGALLHTLTGHTAKINDVAFSPNGNLVASASSDKSARLWNVKDGSQAGILDVALNISMMGGTETHDFLVSSVAFSPDGQTLLLGLQGHIGSKGHEVNAQLWHVADHSFLRALEGESSYVIIGVAFSPDGQTVALASADRNVLVWGLPAASARLAATPTPGVLAGVSPTCGVLPAVPNEGLVSRPFEETGGKVVRGIFLDYWNKNGGLLQQGYPISNEIVETSDDDGRCYTVQYFERAVFEYHPEYAGTSYEVLLSQLGKFQLKRKYPNGIEHHMGNGGGQLFEETGHYVKGRFLDYWNEHGGLARQGLPISDEFIETSELDGKPYTVQYFERAVFEYHPEKTPPSDVLLSQLGTSRYKQKYGSK